jgi:hypothetical protein
VIDLPTIPPTTSTMSQIPLSAAPRYNYQAIFDSALKAYKTKTGKDLTSDPLLRSIENCNSPDAVLAILRAQILEPGQSQGSHNRLTTWLDPTVNVLNAFSPTISIVGIVSFEVIHPGSASNIDFWRHIHLCG